MPEAIRRVRPTPTDAYLDNPHRGCCTFQRFNGDELFPGTSWSEEGPVAFPPAKTAVIDGYLPTTVAYCRWFWRLMEPERGKYDFSVIDQSLETCAQRGQTLAVRLMSFGSLRQPGVPDWYAARHPMARTIRHKMPFDCPVHDAPEYLEHWGGFLREFARRYDGHPRLESIDLAYAGPWGEGDGACCPEQHARFSELYRQAFTKTPRLGQLVEGCVLPNIATGTGWRHDCFGGMDAPGSPTMPRPLSWNCHFDDFPRLIQGPVKHAWQRAPVHLETCGVPMHWRQRGYDIDFILEQGLKYHATYFMPKSTRLPEVWMERLSAFCRRIGYRYVLRQATIQRTVAREGEFHFDCWIDNVGVAPIYRPYVFALRLRQDGREAIVPLEEIDPRAWMPGDNWIERAVRVPPGFRAGWAELAAGILAPGTAQVGAQESSPRPAAIRFAVKEAFSDGWVDLAGIELT